jgi:tetratricopeptide (TPR) repeat protein
MRTLIAVLTLAAAPALAEVCPPEPDRSAETEAIIAELSVAPTEAAGRALNDQLWEIWATAPDAEAQALLDEGMRRRASYDYAGAIEVFDALIAYCPDYAEGYNQRAFARFLRQEFQPALEDLDETLARKPRHIGALSGKALTLLSMGRVKAGQAVLREALALNPWLPERAYLIEPEGEEL